ncbi:MAG: hypothetical protein ACOCTI_07105 [Phycisphaeraceae bacterium]
MASNRRQPAFPAIATAAALSIAFSLGSGGLLHLHRLLVHTAPAVAHAASYHADDARQLRPADAPHHAHIPGQPCQACHLLTHWQAERPLATAMTGLATTAWRRPLPADPPVISTSILGQPGPRAPPPG